jgi:hypothetical protein
MAEDNSGRYPRVEIGLGLITAFAVLIWPDMPDPIKWIGLTLGIAIFLWGMWGLRKEAKIAWRPRVPLRDAAMAVAKAIPGLAPYARMSAHSVEGEIRWYCTALTVQRDNGRPLCFLVGNSPPSEARQLVNAAMIGGTLTFIVPKNGPVILSGQYSHGTIENLTVSRWQLRGAIAQLKKWNGNVARRAPQPL